MMSVSCAIVPFVCSVLPDMLICSCCMLLFACMICFDVLHVATILTRCFAIKLTGVTPHSTVGIISNNRHEWATIAAATYSLNATLVPMYEGQCYK